ncbi:hypothetical protein MJO28_001947 [Puccinia striiformis f. sp. tritici]|uniref:Uncharacterized protein n=1 Tax=Puccinia striiformis f. sp. tritici TaxID=168172 RepID=A0ACC0EX98_9BASI|nr:hypothetical protein MJO28_001947 [Puccinia striiformis f. sp. tritici]
MVAIRHPTNNNINHFLRALPWPIFQMRTYATFLDSERINLNLNNHLPVIDHLMEAFQHWSYIEIHSKIDQSINPIYF